MWNLYADRIVGNIKALKSESNYVDFNKVYFYFYKWVFVLILW